MADYRPDMTDAEFKLQRRRRRVEGYAMEVLFNLIEDTVKRSTIPPSYRREVTAKIVDKISGSWGCVYEIRAGLRDEKGYLPR